MPRGLVSVKLKPRPDHAIPLVQQTEAIHVVIAGRKSWHFDFRVKVNTNERRRYFVTTSLIGWAQT